MRGLNGKRDVVAPISAPMLQIVAIPVAERLSTPGPLYSTMAPVPPLTVRMPATLRMTSATNDKIQTARGTDNPTFRRRPTAYLSREVDADHFGCLKFPRNACHNVNGICTAHTTSDHAQTASVRGMRVSANHKTTRERVVLENNLMNDTRTRAPETEAVLGSINNKTGEVGR
jgi:hypothetical protein